MLLVAAAMLAATDPAAASAAPPAAAPAVQPTKPQKEKKICRVDTNDSSSRLRKTVCYTQTQWDMLAAGKTVNDLKNIGAR